jgi:hypothetical protein
MPITVASLASEIYSDLGSPSDISTASIESWITNNIGLLNTTFGVDYTVAAGAFSPDLSEELKVGYKLLYEIYYLGYSSKLALAGATSAAVEVTSDDGTVRLVNRVELIKVYKDLIKDVRQALQDLVNYYRNDNHAVKQVRFADGFYETVADRVSSFTRSI